MDEKSPDFALVYLQFYVRKISQNHRHVVTVENKR